MAAGYELNGASLATEQTPGSPALPQDNLHTERLALLSEGDGDLSDPEDQEYVYSTQPPDQKQRQMAQRTKVFDKNKMTKNLMASIQFSEA